MDRKRLKDLLQTYSNVAVLLVAIAALSSLAISHLFTPQSTTLRVGLERGMVLGPIPKVDYQESKQTLLIVLNTNCIYCRESLPFFKKLAVANGQSKKSLHIVAVFPNKSEEVATYTRENNLLLDTVAELEFSRLNVSATPSMILINSKGEVNDFWIGKLPDIEADRLIHSLTSKDITN